MVTMDFTPSPVYRHLQVTVTSDDGWCWALEWQKLGVLIMGCIHLMDIASFQLGVLSNYVDGIQAVLQVQHLNEHISGNVHMLNDIWISFFSKIYILITNRLVFLACRVTFRNSFTIFQSKVQVSLFHQELRHQRIGGLRLARIHIISGGHGLTHNFKTGLRKLNSFPLTKFLDPVA